MVTQIGQNRQVKLIDNTFQIHRLDITGNMIFGNGKVETICSNIINNQQHKDTQSVVLLTKKVTTLVSSKTINI